MAFLTANRLRETFRKFGELHGVLFCTFHNAFIALFIPHFTVIRLTPVCHAHPGACQKYAEILGCGYWLIGRF